VCACVDVASVPSVGLGMCRRAATVALFLWWLISQRNLSEMDASGGEVCGVCVGDCMSGSVNDRGSRSSLSRWFSRLSYCSSPAGDASFPISANDMEPP